MLELLGEWIKRIVFIVLFAAFMELLLPNNIMQKFVRVIMGLLIMLVILNPVIDIIQNNKLVSPIPALSSRSNNIYINKQTNNFTDQQDKLSLEIYKKELSNQMKILVTSIDGVSDARINIDIAETHDNKVPFKFKNIHVFVIPGQPLVQTSVNKITIDKNQLSQTSELNPQLVNKIKQTIVELYNISPDIIQIKRAT